MQSDFSLDSLQNFISFAREKGLVSKSTATGWQVAVNKVLEHLPHAEEQDVRNIDVDAALRRFSNRNPGQLAPKSLGEYRRRVAQVINEFITWSEDPLSYKPRGITVNRKRDAGQSRQHKPTPQKDGKVGVNTPSISAVPSSALTLAFPLRPEFLVQVTVPRDIKTEEARRLGAFLLTLAGDYTPAS